MPDSTGSPDFSGSGLVDRRVLQAERDAARAERRVILAQQETAAALRQIDELRAELAEAAHQTFLLRDQIQKIHASTSWRVSRPVRAASNLMQRVRARLGGAAPPSEPIADSNTPADTGDTLGAREQAILRRLQGKP